MDQEQARETLKEQVDQVQAIVRWTAQRKRLNAEEAEDLASYVLLKMVEDDYRILRRFRGKSSLRTYLTVVIQRLTLDFCTQLWGRWRPSAAARRLGASAVRLEQLLYRDGYTLAEAEAFLVSRGIFQNQEEVAALAARLPVRHPRRVLAQETFASVPAPGEEPPMGEPERRAQGRTQRVLHQFLQDLSAEDRKLLSLHFGEGVKVSEIARDLRQRQRGLYTRIYRCLRQMRRALETAGVRREMAATLLDRKDFDVRLDL
jgi:RNA polymerase sigma factor for flagellar operon FliA